jgi:hypothetical protein
VVGYLSIFILPSECAKHAKLAIFFPFCCMWRCPANTVDGTG